MGESLKNLKGHVFQTTNRWLVSHGSRYRTNHCLDSTIWDYVYITSFVAQFRCFAQMGSNLQLQITYICLSWNQMISNHMRQENKNILHVRPSIILEARDGRTSNPSLLCNLKISRYPLMFLQLLHVLLCLEGAVGTGEEPAMVWPWCRPISVGEHALLWHWNPVCFGPCVVISWATVLYTTNFPKYQVNLQFHYPAPTCSHCCCRPVLLTLSGNDSDAH